MLFFNRKKKKESFVLLMFFYLLKKRGNNITELIYYDFTELEKEQCVGPLKSVSSESVHKLLQMILAPMQRSR